jgi:hypothetical protein
VSAEELQQEIAERGGFYLCGHSHKAARYHVVLDVENGHHLLFVLGVSALCIVVRDRDLPVCVYRKLLFTQDIVIYLLSLSASWSVTVTCPCVYIVHYYLHSALLFTQEPLT